MPKKKYRQPRITVSLPSDEAETMIKQAAEAEGRSAANWLWRLARAELVRLGMIKD